VTPGRKEDASISELRDAVDELKQAVNYVRNNGSWRITDHPVTLPLASADWNFTTFEKFINQRFGDLSLQLRERYEAQQTGVTAALAAAEKAVGAALTAAEKAVDKAERAQELRNQVSNEFRESLSDLSGLMWTTKEGQASVDSVRREIAASIDNMDKKVDALSARRIEATETLRKAVESRIGILETGYANLQGRIWSVSALFAIVALAVSIGVRFIGR
jgi:hypothetical protein